MATYRVTNDGSKSPGGWNSQRTCAKDSAGRWWVTFARTISTIRQIILAYSDDNGTTWTEEQVTDENDTQTSPSLAVDSARNVYVAWCGKGWPTYTDKYQILIYKRTFATSAWAQELRLGYPANQQNPCIAIDGNDDVCVAFYGWPPQALFLDVANPEKLQVMFKRQSSSVWQDTELVTDEYYNQRIPSIAIDTNNVANLVWYGGILYSESIHDKILYSKEAWFSTQSWQYVTHPSKQVHQHPCIAIDSLNGIYVVWKGDGEQLLYRKKTGTSWGTRLYIAAASDLSGNPAVSVDKSNNAHIIWKGSTPTTGIAHVEIINEIVGARTILDSNSCYSGNPILMWAQYPTSNIPSSGVAFIWDNHLSSQVWLYHVVEVLGEPGFIWASDESGEVEELHWTDQSGVERAVLGDDTDADGEAGFLFVDDEYIYWLSSTGNVRRQKGFKEGATGKEAGHPWIEGADLHFIDESGDERMLGGTWMLGVSRLGVDTVT